MIETVTGVARRLSQEEDTTQGTNASNKLRQELADKELCAIGCGTSIPIGVSGENGNNKVVADSTRGQLDWYETALYEGLLVTNGPGSDTQVRPIVKCASAGSKPATMSAST